MANTTAGCASVGTPTGGTFLIDYSQQNTAQATATDYASVGASTTLTSASAGFTRMMVGNIFHQTTTGTGAFGVVGWYEIVSFTNTTTVVLDRTPNNGTASVACTGFVGGAGRFNGLEDAYLEMLPAGSQVWIKNGTYAVSGAISVASTNSTVTNPSFLTGYNSLRSDTCETTNRPIIAMGASVATFGVHQNLSNFRFTGTGSSVIITGTGARIVNCKFTNSSTTASRVAHTHGASSLTINCEAISQNGSAFTSAASVVSRFFGCYAHDSLIGFNLSSSGHFAAFNVAEACSTDAFTISAASPGASLYFNTAYGREANIGVGFNFSNATSTLNRIFGNIFYGLTTGITVSTTQQNSNMGMFNDFFNNTTDVTRWRKDNSDLALDPQFVGATQITGTTASGSGSVLTDTNADFSSVTDNVDHVRVLSGTGATIACFLITAHTATTLTCNNTVGTNATADRVYYVTTGHNFGIGTNLKALGIPGWGTAMGVDSTGYIDLGAIQRQEAGGGSGGSFTFS